MLAPPAASKAADIICLTVMILSFRTDRPGQTVRTQIRLLLQEQSCRSSLIRVYTVCHSVCIVWTHYSMVKPHSSNFRVITTNCLGVRKLRIITVYAYQFSECYYLFLCLFFLCLFLLLLFFTLSCLLRLQVKSKYGPRQANLVLIAYASSEGSGESAHPRSLARTFAARSYKQ